MELSSPSSEADSSGDAVMTSAGPDGTTEASTAATDAAVKKRHVILGTLAEALDLTKLYRSPAPTTTSA